MISENARYWIWISQSLGYNSIKVKRISELYSDIADFFSGGGKEWKHCGIFTPNEIKKLNNTKISVADDIIKKCSELNKRICKFKGIICTVSCSSSCSNNRNAKTIIKLRQLSVYINNGRRSINVYQSLWVMLVINRNYRIIKYSVIIVSGGALGVDCASHRGALSANGITVCVLGCGINYKYLTENEGMRKAIAQSGAVISEYPPDEPPLRYNFPARNRIISALSDGLVVMEAGIKSGSLITARMAIDQGKEVFALLGNNSPQNEGSNKLIKEGLAHPVTDFMDILSEFNSNRGLYVEDEKLDFDDISFSDLEAVPVKGKKPTNNKNTAKSKTTKAVKADVSEKKNEKSARNNNSKSAQHKENARSAKKLEDKQENVQKNISDLKASGLSDTAINVYCQISNEPVHIDKIVSELNIPVFKVLTALTQLEIKGYVKAIQGRRYILK